MTRDRSEAPVDQPAGGQEAPVARPHSLDWIRPPDALDASQSHQPPAGSPSLPGRVTRTPRTAQQAEDVAFNDDRMLRRRADNPPAHGWRRLVYQATGGLVRPAPSKAEVRARRLVATLTQPIAGSRTLAVVSTKGGVGKTSIAVNLGHTFAAFRGDRVVALDANPDAGSLAYRIRRETKATILDLLGDMAGERIRGYADIRRFTSQASSRLEVIASPEDPRVLRTLTKDDYRQVLDLLRRHFTLILADCGTGILDPVTQGIVEAAEQLIVVAAPSIDAARAVSFLLSWLTEHGHSPLVSNAVLVLNAVPPKAGPVNLAEIERHFAGRVRAVVRIPWDRYLKTGARITLEDLSPATRDAYVHLAATVADGFAAPRSQPAT